MIYEADVTIMTLQELQSQVLKLPTNEKWQLV